MSFIILLHFLSFFKLNILRMLRGPSKHGLGQSSLTQSFETPHEKVYKITRNYKAESQMETAENGSWQP